MSYRVPVTDIQYSLHAVNDVIRHYREYLPSGDELSVELIDQILEEAAKFAEETVAPLNATGDHSGAKWNDGKVSTPAGFKEAYQQFVEAGWPQLSHPIDFGGQGLPYSLALAVSEMWQTANQSWAMYPALGSGAVATLLAHGSEAQQQQFLPKLISGEWTGTMCLTEAHCGSDLGLLRTRAEPQADGSFQISGSKIFISSGEHDMADNIIHLVLARLPDAPSGSRGISLFIVPKICVDQQGALTEANTLSCGSIEDKMGLKGNATCVMNFDAAQGFLVGPENKGLACMFTFINSSRLAVAQQAQGQAAAAYQTALAYSHERLQGRAPSGKVNTDQAADAIVHQPDVQRMLMIQKVFVEGGRFLIHDCGRYVDLSKHSDADVRQQAENRLALLTPIAKGCLSEWGSESTNLALQVLGGHGYIKEWGIEQRVRDVRITQIYEGTNGIQALDLLARKVLVEADTVLKTFVDELMAFSQSQQSGSALLSRLADELDRHLSSWLQLTQNIAERAATDKAVVATVAFDYLMYAGYVVLAGYWLRSAAVAEQQLADTTADKDYAKQQQASAEFYFDVVLPRTLIHESGIKRAAREYLDCLSQD